MGREFSASCKLCGYKANVVTGRAMSSHQPDYVAAICNSCSQIRSVDETCQRLLCPVCGGQDVTPLGNATRLPDSHLPTQAELQARVSSKQRWFSQNQAGLVAAHEEEKRNFKSRLEGYVAKSDQSPFIAELAKATLEHSRDEETSGDVKAPTSFWELEGYQTLEDWLTAQVEICKRFSPAPEAGLHLCPRCHAHGLSLRVSRFFD
jgi:hypothetical protein